MITRKALVMFGTLTLLIFPLLNVSQATLINGDFSSYLEGWITEDNFVPPSISVSADSGYAALTTQGYPEGAALISLYQPFEIPTWAYTLSFDIGFKTTEADTGGEGLDFSDFVEVSYLDNLDYTYLLGIDAAGTYDPNSFLSIALPQFVANGLTWYHYTTNIADLRGRSVTLYFDLSDQDDTWLSMAYVDNVQINPVPEPPAAILVLGAGLAGLAGGFVRKRKRTLTY
jgi:hypothetical protein